MLSLGQRWFHVHTGAGTELAKTSVLTSFATKAVVRNTLTSVSCEKNSQLSLKDSGGFAHCLEGVTKGKNNLLSHPLFFLNRKCFMSQLFILLRLEL